MSTSTLNIVRGTNSKPVSTDALIEDLVSSELNGELLIGYPIMASPDGRYAVDALLVSPDHGIVSFDLVEGTDPSGFEERQDDTYNRLRARLLTHRDLVRHRELQTPITTVTYAPAGPTTDTTQDHLLLNRSNLVSTVRSVEWSQEVEGLYERTLSAVQSISAIRQPSSARQDSKPGSRAARLRSVEDSISTLDRSA